jgi:hypothetical protein
LGVTNTHDLENGNVICLGTQDRCSQIYLKGIDWKGGGWRKDGREWRRRCSIIAIQVHDPAKVSYQSGLMAK